MKTELFDFALPESKIAQTPLSNRENSKLLICHADGSLGKHHSPFKFTDRHFSDLETILNENDVIVLNNARVVPVRLLGRREETGGSVELVLLRKKSDWEYTTIAHLTSKIFPGMRFIFEPGLIAVCLSTAEERHENHGEFIVKFIPTNHKCLEDWLEEYGHIPLPPYITRIDKKEDRKHYQTVYARTNGSAAAPTAGFHFTERLLNTLKSKGITILDLTLNVGLGTFRPVKAENIEDHPMHEETFIITKEFKDKFADAKSKNKRIVAVGTTVVRSLETWDGVSDGTFSTRAYITPGYNFRHVNDLITNFHLPRSTLIFMVAAAMGLENQKAAYNHAIKNDYRFFSYGDAMFIRGI